MPFQRPDKADPRNLPGYTPPPKGSPSPAKRPYTATPPQLDYKAATSAKQRRRVRIKRAAATCIAAGSLTRRVEKGASVADMRSGLRNALASTRDALSRARDARDEARIDLQTAKSAYDKHAATPLPEGTVERQALQDKLTKIVKAVDESEQRLKKAELDFSVALDHYRHLSKNLEDVIDVLAT